MLSAKASRAKRGQVASPNRDTKLDRVKAKAARAKATKKAAVAKKVVEKSGMSTAKKKLGGATAKPKAKAVGKLAADHWFAKLNKKQQAAYIASHPNSKYAKGAKVKPGIKSEVKTKIIPASSAKVVSVKLSGPDGRTKTGEAMNRLWKHEDNLNNAKVKHKNAKTPAGKLKAKESVAKHRLKVKEAKAKLTAARQADKAAEKKLNAKKSTAKKPTTRKKKFGSDIANERNAKRLAANRANPGVPDKKKRPKPMKAATTTAKKKPAQKTARQVRNALIKKKTSGLSIAQKDRLKNTKFT